MSTTAPRPIFPTVGTVVAMHDAAVEQRDDEWWLTAHTAARVAQQLIDQADTLDGLTTQMRSDSETWFPGLHSGEQSSCPLFMAYTLGLIGEAGEVANVIKKLNRDGLGKVTLDDLGAELADVLIYLLLLAGEVGIDLADAYRSKRARNVERWGEPA